MLTVGDAISGLFRQKKTLEFLAEPVISSGKFSITRDGNLTWRVIEPVESLMEVRGRTVTLDGKRVRGRNMANMMTLLMTGFMQGDFRGISRQFAVTGEVGETEWALRLEARSERMKSVIGHIALGGGQYLHFIDILETGGNGTRIDFSEVSISESDDWAR